MNPTGRMILLETTSRAGEVALAEGTSLVASRLLATTRRNASDLALVVDELLHEQGWTTDSVNAVAVSLGPGSFTSLRVGLISARTLAYALGCDFLGLGTFEIIAEQVQQSAAIVVISDALKGMVYTARYEKEQGQLREVVSPNIQALDEVLMSLTPATILTGPGVESYSSRIPSGTSILPKALRQPRCETMLRLLSQRIDAYRCDLWSTEPIYLRGSSAEEKRAAEVAATIPLVGGATSQPDPS